MRFDSSLGALGERNFRLYFVGQLASWIGTGMAMVALAFAVFRTERSATALGVVLMAEAVPLALFILVGGVVADRIGRRRVMLGSDVLRGCAQAALGAWVLTARPPLWGFAVLVALVGTGTAFFSPAVTGIIPEVVTPPRLAQANALDGLANSIGMIAGPAVAGVIVATASPGWAIVADASSYGVSVVSLALLQLPPIMPKVATTFLGQLQEGWKEFWSRSWLWTISVQWWISDTVIFGSYYVLGALVASKYLGGAPTWGTILAVGGAGSVVGGLVMLRVRPKRPMLVATLSTLVFPWPLLALAYRAPLPVIAAGAFFMGAAMAIVLALWNTTVQREVPAEVLSRVSAYDLFGSLVFLPIGYAIVGPVSGAVGIRATFLGASIWCVASVAVVVAVPSVRRLTARDAPAT